MGALKVTVDCRVSGPLADGTADAALGRWRDATARELTLAGQTYIQTDAQGFDKSGRGGTGRAAEGVKAHVAGGVGEITGGIEQGDFAWPWLEGTSKRNTTTAFSGYHTFRKTRLRLDKEAQAVGERQLAQIMPALGGP